ncbi:AAA family ATPase [Saccharopolyspora gloriosae]|uniref:Putative ATPase n=1 Tax=Saccharopolyspora gloriosae TaxID=455344 RepID=A0A840NE18_9PSEU|nr:AAA family ATPase [Saccharopolyspora gloriosae]MBB5068468.1 putative ATPase [Saccharopolyspora gloriosae]
MAPGASIERLRVRNYRVLRDVTFENLSPLTVLFGPNGSGKSTVIDVFAFLHEAFTTNLRRAWDARGRMAEIRSRGCDGPVEIELTYRPGDGLHQRLTYLLRIDEADDGRPVVLDEALTCVGAGRLLDVAKGAGVFEERNVALDGSDMLAAPALGQFEDFLELVELRRFISSWYLSHLGAGDPRAVAEIGPQERISGSGENLPNVLRYLREQHPGRLDQILKALRQRVPNLERIEPEEVDGRLALRLKDLPFDEPIYAKFASEGTLRLLAYLIVLHDPVPASIVGIEEPENQLHPRLLHGLAEECRSAAQRSPLLVTTHSPQFADALRLEELWALHRGSDGFALVTRASEIPQVVAMAESGGTLGDLWMEGYFGVGDPLDPPGRDG